MQMTNSSFTQKMKKLVLGSIQVTDFDRKKPNLISMESTLVPMHVARTGEFKGYRDGEFELTQDIFAECIDNFYSESNPLPVYRGHADVVGSINGEEPPSCGWILGLKADESGNLFALVELTKEIEEEIKAGKYKFTSIYMKGDELHRETGEDIGCRLVSLALTNQPFIDNLESIQLSMRNSNKNHNYISKEIPMRKNKIVLQTQEPLANAEKAIEQMDEMQEGKVMAETDAVDPMKMIEEIKNIVDPEMTTEDFIKSLIEAFMKMHEAKETIKEEVVEEEIKIAEEALAETVTEEEIKTEEDKEAKETEVTAAALSISLGTVKSLNLELSNARKEIDSLKKELQKEKDVMLSNVVSEAIAKGKILDVEKESFLKLGRLNKSLFDEMLATRISKPSVVLGRISNDSDKQEERKTASKLMNLNDRDRKMLEGAKVKI